MLVVLPLFCFHDEPDCKLTAAAITAATAITANTTTNNGNKEYFVNAASLYVYFLWVVAEGVVEDGEWGKP